MAAFLDEEEVKLQERRLKKYEKGTDRRKIISPINVYVKVPSFWSDCMMYLVE